MTKKFNILSEHVAYALLLFVGAILMPEIANAAATPPGGGATTLGGVMARMVSGTSNFPLFVGAAAYLAATYITVSAVFKVVDHIREPDRTPLWDPLKRFIVAGSFFALPTVMGAVQQLMLGGGLAGLTLTGGGAATGGLDGAMISFVRDVANNGSMLVNAFSYAAAVAITAFALSRLLRSTQEGPKGPTGFGTWMMFIVAAALFSLPSLMSAMQGSLFGGGLQGYNVLAGRNVGLTAGEAARVTNVTNAVIGFLFFLGWVSFVRGIFIIREVSDGGQASLMAGVTHLVGGGLAVNVGSFMQAVERTLGI